MSYVKDWFLEFAWQQTNIDIRIYAHNIEDQRKNAVARIVEAYQQQPEVHDYMICQKVYELARNATVEDRLIVGKWKQLAGLLKAYHSQEIEDIGISMQVVWDQLDQEGKKITGKGAIINDSGNGRLHIQSSDDELQKLVREVVDQTDKQLPRFTFFEHLKASIKRKKTEERVFTITIDTYLFIDGEQDQDLLQISPNSFAETDPYVDMDERPEEYRHLQQLLEELKVEQIAQLLIYCGLDTEEGTQKLLDVYHTDESRQNMVLDDMKKFAWYADKEDFYREYRRLSETTKDN
ncbi:hypothetical protein BRC19_03040 [Candidatus Saccharibacteria bacterium QS_5_54_17]|nr:MAG: hypothetical protein BRC19_03040 [Candidatus Saccharibacteria bacterium QS_5_54_17]